ncbi:MAG TPA: four helix bundle protein [Chitinophagales bacterium]|nr:four helix bundle protein [Chitinophagales bacterium]
MKADLIENNVILSRTIDFSLSVISYCELLESEKKYIVARQLLRSGTLIGANSFEAQNCESNADFIHKFKIAAKEINETQYWLLLCKRSENYPDCEELLKKVEEIDRIVNKIISSAKKKKPLSYFLALFMF